jgi:hypothetical protein
VRRAVLAMTHSYPQGYIPIADAWQEACSKLAPPESKPLDNATFDDDAYDAKVRIVERLMRSALADGRLPVFVQTKNGETERLTDREQWRAAALVPDIANIPEPVTNPGPETDGRPALLKVSDLQEWIRRLRVQDEILTNEQPSTPKAAPIDAASATSLVADEVEKHAIAVQQWWREFVERAFNKPDWSQWEVFSWIAWRDPTQICAIQDDSTLRAYRRHGLDRESSDEPVDDDSDFTLVDALKKGRLAAIRDGAELPREYWFGKAPRDLGPNVYFRREDVLAVWPAVKDLRSDLEAAYEASTGRWLDSRVEANAIAEASLYHRRIEGSKADAADEPAGYDATTTPSHAISAHSPAAARWASSNADETRCFRWLVKKMQAAPDRPETKIVLWPEAKEHFRGLSERGFNRVWIAAAAESGASKWSFQGRRSKRK